MTDHEETTKILEEYIEECVTTLDKGSTVRVTGGYRVYNKKDTILQRYCETIVRKLSSLGYEYTTNHGFGCYDYIFSKPIKL